MSLAPPLLNKITAPTLTLSRRFELCFGRKLGEGLGERVALEQYGPVAAAVSGSGVNATVRVAVSGPVDPVTGMIANLVDIKERFGDLLEQRYDHRMLNLDTPPFDIEPPTIERIAQQMRADISKAADGQPYQLDQVSYRESDTSGARVCGGATSRIEWLELSAARETGSPHLSPGENERLFGEASRLHGHTYRIGLELHGAVHEQYGVIVSAAALRRAVTDVKDEFDHRSFNELRAFRGRPVTTESFSRLLFDLLTPSLPVARVTVCENRWFGAATDGLGTTLTLRDNFPAMHRLHRPQLSDDENRALYGVCNHPNGHGHDYHVALTIRGTYDERTGTIAELSTLQETMNRVLARYRHRFLDRECEEFATRPSSGEVIAELLWARFRETLGEQLETVQVDETGNNRFRISREER